MKKQKSLLRIFYSKIILWSKIIIEFRIKNLVSCGLFVKCYLDDISAIFFVTEYTDTIQRHHLRGEFYEDHELRMMRKYFGGGIFVDVGCNVGNHSIYFASLENCRSVIAFEPNPNVLKNLLVNLALNGLSKKVVLHQFGLADVSCNAKLSIPRLNAGGASFLKNPDRSDEFSSEINDIPLMRGDDILGDEKISLMKIDVEGLELECLKGLDSVLRNSKPILFVEVTHETRPDVESFLSDRNYKIIETYQRYPKIINIIAKYQKS
jgi:FkbM family methyltransferase